MGGEKERAELAAFEALFSKWIANALVAELRKERDVLWGADGIANISRASMTKAPQLRLLA